MRERFTCLISKDCNITVDLMLSTNYRLYLGYSSYQCLPLEKLENTFFRFSSTIPLQSSNCGNHRVHRVVYQEFYRIVSGIDVLVASQENTDRCRDGEFSR